MKKQNLIAVAVAAACSIPTAFAQENTANYDNGFYVGAQAGQFICDGAQNIVAGTGFSLSCDEALAVRVNGGFQLNDYFSFEMGYLITDDTELVISGDGDISLNGNRTAVTGLNASPKFSYSAIDLSFLASYPLTDSFSVHGRAGVAFWENSTESWVATATRTSDSSEVSESFPSEDETGEDFLYGIGAKLLITDSVSGNFDWTRMEGDDGDTPMDTIMVGLTYRF